MKLTTPLIIAAAAIVCIAVVMFANNYGVVGFNEESLAKTSEESSREKNKEINFDKNYLKDSESNVSLVMSESGVFKAYKVLPQYKLQPFESSAAVLHEDLYQKYLQGDTEAAFRLFEVLDACYKYDVGFEIDNSVLNCEELSFSNQMEKWEILEFAADNGNPYAMVSYLSKALDYQTAEAIAQDLDGFADFRQRLETYLTRAAEMGDLRAILSLSSEYETGVLLEQNYFNAYYYSYIHHLIFGGGAGRLNVLGSNLNASQILDAQNRANNFVAKK